MDPEYARRYRDLYERHWWWRAREHLILATLRRYLPPGGWRTILDVGCGDGVLFDRLAAFGDVEGVEADPPTVSAAGRPPTPLPPPPPHPPSHPPNPPSPPP